MTSTMVDGGVVGVNTDAVAWLPLTAIRSGLIATPPASMRSALLTSSPPAHRAPPRLHEERTVDLIAARPVLLCVYIGVDTDGGGCRDIYSEDGSRVTADLLGIS
ncbi:hypothetical protein B296_00019655 [Ensete ventricosum]|uniref:Uncharacterized protein n=1 Tax=Ensete ventricosum TaxID=4639 RepID=A0A427AES8_ENSVE|nr:hypothetical protein B296_00019655 [Ensete ventricosum]